MSLTAFATYLAQTTLAVSVLIAFILLIRRPFAQAFGAKAAYTLWAIPLLRLILPPIPANWTLLGWLQNDPAASVPSLTSQAVPAPFIPPLDTPDINIFVPANPVPLTEQASFNLSETLQSASPILIGLWALGMIGFIAITLIRQRATANLIVAESHSPSQAVLTLARQTGHGLGLHHEDLDVKISLISSGPLVTGLLKPTVLLPEWFETDYTHAEQKFALTHEMMHIRRHDLWALYAATFAAALQWFNPFAWLALKAFRTDQESACDADVLASDNTCRHAYGVTLVKAARISRPVAQPVHAASLPLNHALQERLTIMKNPLPSARQRFTGTLLTASVGAAALLASACALSANAQDDTLAGGIEDENASIVTVQKDGDTKRMLLLNDPFAELNTRLGSISTLDNGLADLDGLLSELDTELSAFDTVEIADEALFFLTDLDNAGLGERITRFTGELSTLIENGDYDEDAIETLTANFEAEMDAWADSFETHFEAKSDDWANEFEARAEAMAERIEARAESINNRNELIDHHAEHIKLAGESIEELAEQCQGQRGIQIVTTRKDSGQEARVNKAICLDETEALDTSTILEELRATGKLTEAELARVESGLSQISIGQNDHQVRIELKND